MLPLFCNYKYSHLLGKIPYTKTKINIISSSITKMSEENGSSSSLVYAHKLTSVGPGNISGNNKPYTPNNIDLAMKLHYIKLVYFLDKKAVEKLTLRKIKECLFAWLNYYYEACGRFRCKPESSRPYIKCNDCGMRILEAKTSKTIDEWLIMEDLDFVNLKFLVPDHVIGPELTFSPLAFLQTTFFKCGGISLGLSWAHVLGDAFCVATFMNILAQFFSGQEPNYAPYLKSSPLAFQKPIKSSTTGPFSIQDVGPVGDHWIKPTLCEMDTFTFQLTNTHPFEMLCAVIWQGIARIKIGPKPNIVTIVKKDDTGPIEDELALRNNQIVSTVKADFSVEVAQLNDLVTLIRDWAHDERAQIGEIVDRDPGGSDFVMYGSNLTFVDFREANFYGFEVKGLRPRLVNCYLDGIGEEGAVLVIPGPFSNNENGYVNQGRLVTLIMPKSYMVELKKELKKEWSNIY